MRVREVLGHEGALEGLWRAAQAGRLPHALLFAGPRGAGKFLAAERLAAGLLCADGPGPPCGTCGPCKRFRSGSHPDVLAIDLPSENAERPPAEWEEAIRVQRIAVRAEGDGGSVEEFVGLRPAEGGWRCVLIREAERMAPPAQNALLKILEEPGSDTLLVLETSASERLLPTIHSRCVRVELGSLERESAAACLVGEGLAADAAARLARWAAGAPGRALELAERGAEEVRAVLVARLCGEVGPAGAAALVRAAEGRFEGRTPLAATRLRVRSALDLALDLLADLQRAARGLEPEGLRHGDLLAGEAPALQVGPEHAHALRVALEGLLELSADLDANLDPDTVLERALELVRLPGGARAAYPAAGGPT